MLSANEKIYKAHLIEEAMTYLVTGIVISVSHHFHALTQVVFFGHLLIVISFMILFSMIFNYKWMRRISNSLDIFSGTTFIITLSIDIAIFLIDELTYYTQSKTLTQPQIDHLFITILIIVVLWLLLLCVPLVAPAFNRRLSFKAKFPSFFLVVALLLLLVNYFLKILQVQNILFAELFVMFVILLILQIKTLSKIKLSLIFLSHLSFLLVIGFGLGGILSFFTQAISPRGFWKLSILAFCIFIISIFLLTPWRRRIFNALRKLYTNSILKLKVFVNWTQRLFVNHLSLLLIRMEQLIYGIC